MTQQQMEALVWTKPRVMEVQHVPLPTLGDDEVLIEVGAVGVCGSELSACLGHNSLRTPPLIMGHEAAGTVVAISGGTFADGSAAITGARVTFNPLLSCGTCDTCSAGLTHLCRSRILISAARPGAFARFVAVPARQCYRLPDTLSFVAGSLVEPLACGIRAVRQSRASEQSSLFIIGAGPIGLCCLAAARAQGIERVIISDVADTRLAVAHAWGAQAVVNAQNDNILQAVQSFQPGGVSHVIDAVGTNQTREQAVRSVTPGGTVVFIGLHDEASPLAANYLVRQEITITGSFCYTAHDFEDAMRLLTEGVVRPEQSWLEERPLVEGPAVFEELLSGTATATKIVLR
jgi:threonine dehydrogenase-like Zn-dependent dehydrogenase